MGLRAPAPAAPRAMPKLAPRTVKLGAASPMKVRRASRLLLSA